MTTYSVADAKNGLPRLIDRALGGDDVIISRHGKPVVEIRPVVQPKTQGPAATYEWLRSRRQRRPGTGLNSVEVLRLMYEEPGA